MITIDIEQEIFEETSVGVLGYISDINEKDPDIPYFMFRLSLNSMHYWELHVRSTDNTWYISYTFPQRFEIEDYHNRNVIRWLMTNYHSLRILALGIRKLTEEQ